MRQISRPGARPALAKAGCMMRLAGCLLVPLEGWTSAVGTGNAGRVLNVPAELNLVEMPMNTTKLLKVKICNSVSIIQLNAFFRQQVDLSSWAGLSQVLMSVSHNHKRLFKRGESHLSFDVLYSKNWPNIYIVDKHESMNNWYSFNERARGLWVIHYLHYLFT